MLRHEKRSKGLLIYIGNWPWVILFGWLVFFFFHRPRGGGWRVGVGMGEGERDWEEIADLKLETELMLKNLPDFKSNLTRVDVYSKNKFC